ncbi:MAG: signal peptidase I [Ardenticatenaceae bacterium]|nr:signal peptidase I [Anaerolineales bacterium]MCB8939573.1 signal peptidase I [Ardenticatenaceae bacterium]MCB8975004.1 signal peptidase I [Ardenticatenaceae bacterium]
MALTESNAPQPSFHDTPAAAERKQPTELVVREIVETLLLTFFIFWLVNSFVGRYRIDGSSMNPTLENGQYLLINNFSYYLNEPNHGDIIVFKHPNSDLNLIKRVIGVPGDHVEIRDRQVMVNGVLLAETYIQAEPTYTGDWTVPNGEFFVLGDNRNSSSDSHSWGFLPEANIIGKAVVVYWPISDWELVPHVDLSINER